MIGFVFFLKCGLLQKKRVCSQFISFRVDPFSELVWYAGKQTGNHRSYLPCKNDGTYTGDAFKCANYSRPFCSIFLLLLALVIRYWDPEQKRSFNLHLLTLVMLNKLRCNTHFEFPADQITWSGFLIEIHIFNDKQCRSRWQKVQIRSTLFAKTGHVVFSKRRVNGVQRYRFMDLGFCCPHTIRGYVSESRIKTCTLIKRRKFAKFHYHVLQNLLSYQICTNNSTLFNGLKREENTHTHTYTQTHTHIQISLYILSKTGCKFCKKKKKKKKKKKGKESRSK